MRIHVLHVPGASPARDANVADLKSRADVCMHEDPERRGVMANWASAVACANEYRQRPEILGTRNGWQAIIQDDAVLLPDWEYNLDAATRFSPTPILGLTNYGPGWRDAARRGFHYVQGRNVLVGTAIAYNWMILGDLAAFARDAARTDYKHDDIAASIFCTEIARNRFEPAITSRAVFDILDREPSLVGHAPYLAPYATIANTVSPGWSPAPRVLQTKKYARRDDDGVLLNMLAELPEVRS